MATINDQTVLEVLHPAANVFRSVVLGDIGGDNARLKKEISELLPLDEYMKITIEAPTDDEPLSHKITTEVDDDGITVINNPRVNREVISKASLSEGTLLHDEDGDKLTFPIVSSPPLLLVNIGAVGGIRLRMANEVMSFPADRGCSNTAVSIANADTVILTIFLSVEVSIQCKLNGLALADFIAFKEGSYNADRLTSMLTRPTFIQHRMRANGWTDMILSNQGEGVTVTPTLLTMNVTPALRQTLDDLMKATISGRAPVDESRELSPSDELLKLTVEALGDDEQKQMLEDNRLFRLQHDALVKLKERLLTVELSHGGKSLKLSLGDGKLVDFEDGARWCIHVENKDNSSMVVNDIFSSIFSYSGTRLNTGRVEGGGQFLLDEEGMPWGSRIRYKSWLPQGIDVIGHFNWNQLEDLSNILDDNFHRRFSFWADNRHFPDSFELDIVMVRFHPVLVVDVLTTVGLGDKLVKAPNE